MAPPYRPFVLSEIIRETPDIRTFVCTPADGQPAPAFKAGQFFMLRISDVPGLRPPMRSYSAARASRPESLSFGVKLHGPFTHALFEKKKGDKIEISGPYGFFTIAGEGAPGAAGASAGASAASAPIVLLAAGIGITPLLCMAEELTLKKDPRQVQLFCSNRNPDDVAFAALLEGLAGRNPNLRLITTLTCEPRPAGYAGECGRITKELLERHGTDFASSHFYFCGPKEFNAAMQSMLEGAGVEKERMHKEAW